MIDPHTPTLPSFRSWAGATRRFAGAALVAGLALTGASVAQDTSDPTGDGLGLDMGTPSAEAPLDAIGQPYLLELSGDWQISCIRTELEHDPCGMVQLLSDAEGNSVVRIRLVNIPDGGPAAAGANIVTPLETLLSRQITLSVDGGPEKVYGFTYCTQVSCVANVGFTEEEVEQFRRGAAADITIFPLQAPDQPVTARASLSGFTAGYARITELNALNAQAVREAQAAQQQGSEATE